jgi:hypothetical protein
MDRQIVYVGALARTRDVLLTNKNTMLALGMAMQAVIGTSRLVDGLSCTPTSPPSLTVNISPGSIYDYQVVDQAAYGILSADTDNFVVKQGISLSPLTFNCPAPATTGYSQNYLVQVALLEEDGGSTVLPFYNANNPSQPFNGPNNSGTSSNTVRQDLCAVTLKAGAAATTGTQTTPAPDTGYTGLWVITVANGQTAIDSSHIAEAADAPFIVEKLNDKISAATADQRYASLSGYQRFTSSGTFTTPANSNVHTVFRFRLQAGGASGGSVSGSPYAAASGGSSGGWLDLVISGLSPGTNIPIVIGAGGAAPAAGNNSGNTGGNSTITIGATTYTAFGGLGGISDSGDGAYGAAAPVISTNGTANYRGTPSTPSSSNGTTAALASPGAPSIYGGGGAGAAGAANGGDATNPGSGGGGASSGSTSTAKAGGKGADGCCEVSW